MLPQENLSQTPDHQHGSGSLPLGPAGSAFSDKWCVLTQPHTGTSPALSPTRLRNAPPTFLVLRMLARPPARQTGAHLQYLDAEHTRCPIYSQEKLRQDFQKKGRILVPKGVGGRRETLSSRWIAGLRSPFSTTRAPVQNRRTGPGHPFPGPDLAYTPAHGGSAMKKRMRKDRVGSLEAPS
jgi:hypothetical protein